MPAFRLLVDGSGSGRKAATALNFGEQPLGGDGATSLCELPLVSAISGVYNAERRHLAVISKPSTRLADQPLEVKALLCACSKTEPEFVVLLAPEHGATMLLPREGSPNASEVRARPSPTADGAPGAAPGCGAVVVLARGPDPYSALLDACNTLTEITGSSADETRAYVLPLLDVASRMRYDAAIAVVHGAGAASSGVTSGKSAEDGGAAASSAAATAAATLEQQLHEGILVQAGPGCPAKPLLQAPGLRLCQGGANPLGLRYSGMSVVYGTATGHVLAVMDTAAALKMAPAAGMRSSTGGSLPSVGSGASFSLGGADSPAGVSAGISAATSATPSPPFSRASSCGAALGDAAVAAAATAADADSKPASAAASDGGSALQQLPAAPPPLALSGRSITASPIIQVIAAAGGAAQQSSPLLMPTSAAARVLASFAVIGVKAATSRDGTVRCCRIMPASALSAAAADEGGRATAGAAAGLGLAVQVELSCTSAGTLRLFLEGPEEHHEQEHQAAVVRHVSLDGRPARWRHDAHGCVLAVELPVVAAAASARIVQVYL